MVVQVKLLDRSSGLVAEDGIATHHHTSRFRLKIDRVFQGDDFGKWNSLIALIGLFISGVDPLRVLLGSAVVEDFGVVEDKSRDCEERRYGRQGHVCSSAVERQTRIAEAMPPARLAALAPKQNRRRSQERAEGSPVKRKP